LALAGPAAAQLISIKTVPIAQGDQFEIFPSNNFGMGSVSIALPDTLLDPFLNPAKGARLGAARFFGAPTAYGISQGAGGGRALPRRQRAVGQAHRGGRRRSAVRRQRGAQAVRPRARSAARAPQRMAGRALARRARAAQPLRYDGRRRVLGPGLESRDATDRGAPPAGAQPR